MTIVAHTHGYVIGVDTHARTHTLAIIATPLGLPAGEGTFPTNPAGIARMIDWVTRRTSQHHAVLWVIEGIATYGANLARALTTTGHTIIEAPRLPTPHQSLGKSDLIDAHRIATAALPLEPHQLRYPRKDNGTRAALRTLMTARNHMTHERTATINALTALLRSTHLGTDARKPLTKTQLTTISRWRTRTENLATATARTEATRLAKRIITLDHDITHNTKTTTTLLKHTPAHALLTHPGIGPITAAIAITTWSHNGRLHSEAAFASLAGVNPIPASSGNTTRHRLNRGGDRRLNQALHTTITNRMTHDPQTRTYVQRRLTEGLTKPEIRRILKRYLARQIYRTLTTTTDHNWD